MEQQVLIIDMTQVIYTIFVVLKGSFVRNKEVVRIDMTHKRDTASNMQETICLVLHYNLLHHFRLPHISDILNAS